MEAPSRLSERYPQALGRFEAVTHRHLGQGRVRRCTRSDNLALELCVVTPATGQRGAPDMAPTWLVLVGTIR